MLNYQLHLINCHISAVFIWSLTPISYQYIYIYISIYISLPWLAAVAIAATLGIGVAMTMAHGQPSTNKINPVKRKNDDDDYFFVMIFSIMAMSMNLRLMMIIWHSIYIPIKKSKTHHPKHSTVAKKPILLCLLPVWIAAFQSSVHRPMTTTYRTAIWLETIYRTYYMGYIQYIAAIMWVIGNISQLLFGL